MTSEALSSSHRPGDHPNPPSVPPLATYSYPQVWVRSGQAMIPRPPAQKLHEGARPWISLAADAGPASGETDADGEEAPGARGRRRLSLYSWTGDLCFQPRSCGVDLLLNELRPVELPGSEEIVRGAEGPQMPLVVGLVDRKGLGVFDLKAGP